MYKRIEIDIQHKKPKYNIYNKGLAIINEHMIDTIK
jgi:hypothetical protein